MAWRCGSCNKFATVDESNHDANVDAQIVQDGDRVYLSGTVTVTLLSECCGDQLAESYIEFEEDLPDGVDEDWDFADDGTELIAEREKGRKYYGVIVTGKLTKDGQEPKEIEFTVKEQAGYFDACN